MIHCSIRWHIDLFQRENLPAEILRSSYTSAHHSLPPVDIDSLSIHLTAAKRLLFIKCLKNDFRRSNITVFSSSQRLQQRSFQISIALKDRLFHFIKKKDENKTRNKSLQERFSRRHDFKKYR